MNILGWLELAIFLIVLLLITKPLGIHLVQVLDTHGKTFMDPVVKPVEKITYRLLGVDPEKEQSWLQYTIALLVFTVVTVLFTYAILRLQGFLPLNQDPKTFQAVTDHVAFNTAISFSTNTNWQSYSGESTMTYFSQMVGLAVHNFMSAAAGIAVAAAVVRGIARHTAKTIGNFWVDLTRITYYLLLPICFFYALFLVWQGVPQNFKPYQTAKVVEAQKVQVQKKDANGNPVNDAKGNPVMEEQTVDSQTVTEGPMAAQMAIKMLGTNGGGFVNANAAPPIREPDASVEFHSDVINLRHPQCPHLLPGQDGEEPETWLGRLGNHGARVCDWVYYLLGLRG